MASAIKQLEGPPFPEELRYLYEWGIELHGRSGVTMSGLAPLTYTTIDAWCRLTEIALEPREVQALMILDSAMLFPGIDTDEEDERGSRHAGHPDRQQPGPVLHR